MMKSCNNPVCGIGTKNATPTGVADAMARWSREGLFDALAAQRVVAGPVFNIDEMGRNPQLQARGFFRTSFSSSTRFPGPFARMSESSWHLNAEMPIRLPRLASTPAAWMRSSRIVPAPKAKGRWPACAAWCLRKHGQAPMRRSCSPCSAQKSSSSNQRASRQLARHLPQSAAKRLQNVATAQHAWNCNPLYNSVNLNKQCITVDLATADGVDLFKSLVAHVDFVARTSRPA